MLRLLVFCFMLFGVKFEAEQSAKLWKKETGTASDRFQLHRWRLHGSHDRTTAALSSQ